MKTRKCLSALAITVATMVESVAVSAPFRASAAPAPEVEYVYDVMVRRHYNFVDASDAVGYGYAICDRIGRGGTYAQVMGEVKNHITPNDEFAANYLVSNAVNLLCPALIWQLRDSAAHYQPPAS
jgi:hypothetical protein